MTTVKKGDVHATVVVEDLTRTQLVMYSGASGDYNPLHSDDLYTREVAGYPGVFCHGMLTMGMSGRAVTDLVGADKLKSYGGRFQVQVWPGDTLTATVTVTDVTDGIAELAIVTTNQKGEAVFTGKATAYVD
jgi:acyl dehydratase